MGPGYRLTGVVTFVSVATGAIVGVLAAAKQHGWYEERFKSLEVGQFLESGSAAVSNLAFVWGVHWQHYWEISRKAAGAMVKATAKVVAAAKLATEKAVGDKEVADIVTSRHLELETLLGDLKSQQVCQIAASIGSRIASIGQNQEQVI